MQPCMNRLCSSKEISTDNYASLRVAIGTKAVGVVGASSAQFVTQSWGPPFLWHTDINFYSTNLMPDVRRTATAGERDDGTHRA